MNNTQTKLVSKKFYTSMDLLKASYSFIDQVYFHFDDNRESDEWIIHFTPKDPTDLSCDYSKEFENELIAQAVRRNVYTQTHSIREILLARAMSSSMIDTSDPLDRIENEQNRECENLEEILKSWFDQNE